MFSMKLSRFCAVAILATLGAQNLVWGQAADPPRCGCWRSNAAPQFRPLTEADVQDALARVKAAADALDQRFATAGTSADGWKEYLSWDKFKANCKRPSPTRPFSAMPITSWRRAMKGWS